MAEEPIVRVEQGQLQGKSVTSPNGKCFYSFQGIPYAKPPLGSFRFQAPQPVEPWEGIRDATAEGNVSAQIDPFIHKEFIGDENCLFLNVYTPKTDGEPLPVMIFIHGGGFKFGSGNTSFYGGDYLVEKDVVVVTINYRCGALGFLCLNTPEVPGNAGLKDMSQAIRWVKNNIHNFAGDSNNVTIFGESVGGVAVSLLTASPLTKDLISKAIIQSGTGLNNWAFQKNPVDHARELVKELGGDAEDAEDILEFLRATSVRDIVDAYDKLQTPNLFFEKALIFFAPVVEKEFPGVEAALTEAFVKTLSSGCTSNVPIMIGSTTLEFIKEYKNDDLRDFIPEQLQIDRNSEEANIIAENIRNVYFKSGHIGHDMIEYYQLVSDKLVNIDTHRYVKALVNVARAPTYYYKFDYVGELNLSGKIVDGSELKYARHVDELGYLFKNIFQNDIEPTSKDVNMREQMVRLWTNFAKYGNPTPSEDHYLNVSWLPITKDALYYLNMGDELSLQSNPDQEKMVFWEQLYNKYYKIENEVNSEVAPEEKEVGEEEAAAIDHSEEVIPTNSVAGTVDEESIEEVVATNNAIEEKEDIEVLEEKVENVPEDITKEPIKEENVTLEPVNDAVVNVERKPQNGDIKKVEVANGIAGVKKIARTSNEIKMISHSNGTPKDVVRANDPPEDDLPKNIGVNKFVQIYESLIAKKK